MTTTAKLLDVFGARNRRLDAWYLAQHPDRVLELLAARRWEQLIPFAQAIQEDVPRELAATDPALYRTLRKAFTEIHVRGLALKPDVLQRYAAEHK